MEKETNTTPSYEGTADETMVSNGEVAASAEDISVTDGNSSVSGVHTDSKEDIGVSDPGSVENSAALSELDRKSAMREEFERLIKGDYKEFYEERVKENLGRRFRETQHKRQLNADNGEIARMMYDRYNVSIGDIRALKDAIESDNAYLAAQADKRGMSIEDYKYIRKLETENRDFYEREAMYEAERHAGETVRKWYEESQSVKETYPEFDIFSESRNPAFVSLLKSGIDVKTAYEAVHHSELVMRAAEAARADAEKKTADAIRQRAMRPAENGLSSVSSAILKNNVSSLSAKQREEIAQRAARGEKITF